MGFVEMTSKMAAAIKKALAAEPAAQESSALRGRGRGNVLAHGVLTQALGAVTHNTARVPAAAVHHPPPTRHGQRISRGFVDGVAPLAVAALLLGGQLSKAETTHLICEELQPQLFSK